MIRIQNIYYMLSYAFTVLKEQGYKELGSEDFENTAELLSEILIKGINSQIKRGLGKTYNEQTETLSGLRGKIDLQDSIKRQTVIKQQLVCTYDEFTTNTYSNQIIKSTIIFLLKSDISKTRKKKFKNLLMYFADADMLDIHSINWKIKYNRNNQTYRMLINICYLIIEGLLQKQSEGNYKLMDYIDEQNMNRLYEKFILEYYRKEHPELHANPAHVDWALDNDYDFMLPTMRTDVTLTKDNKTLIIDAKYYDSSTQNYYNTPKNRSGNIYQIFTYVKNKAEEGGEVSGMLLYAKTDDEVQPDNEYMMSGNKISVKNLDLDLPFAEIKNQLDNIVAYI